MMGGDFSKTEEIGLGLPSSVPIPSSVDIADVQIPSSIDVVDDPIASSVDIADVEGFPSPLLIPPSVDKAVLEEFQYCLPIPSSVDIADVEGLTSLPIPPSVDIAVLEEFPYALPIPSSVDIADVEGFTSPLQAPPSFDLADVEGELQNLGLEEDSIFSKTNSAPKEEKKIRRFHYPLRPDEPDCTFYLRTGTCRFASNCKFNHPPRWKSQVGREKDTEREMEMEKEKEKEKEENGNEKENGKEDFPEREGQPECKYYLKTGGCKFGKACRYNHPREKSGAGEPVELNFLGLPIRPGEKECPFYMRTGSCKFATNCRFHHPDPIAVGGSDPSPVYRNKSSLPLHASTESPPLPTMWPLQRTSNEPVPYMEASPPPYMPVMLSPPHGVHPDSEWNDYLGPASQLFPPERNIQAPSASAMNDLTMKAESFARQLQTTIDEFPERPGQPECQFFMRTGDCKFRSACRYHHPKSKSRVSKSPACVLSPMGLPLRPDQNICTHYSRYGICKFGPSCKYDHPLSVTQATPVSDQHTFLNMSTSEEARVPTCENGNEVQF